jgi:N-acetylated-alpha-linked acidic dipeptidase
MNKILITLILILIVKSSHAQTTKITGFHEKNIEKQLNLESAFDKNLSGASIGENIRILSSKPHNIGSPGSKENAEYILSLFRQWGWDAKIDTFYVLFPTPRTRILEMISPTTYKAGLKEPVIKEDPSTDQQGQLPTYNAFGADGDVTGELVFANYGLPEDYDLLDRMKIDVKGKIVIVKYGRSWRGVKPKIAQEHGAIGCIIYSDPIDDGYFHGDVYPKGAFRTEYAVQRGSVMDMPVYPGDPLTPGEGATKDAKRLERADAKNLIKIPVLPISYHDASPLLQALDGPVVPFEWHGGLPFAIHFGPGKAKVHLKVISDWNTVPCYDVIAKMQGSRFPDQWIIRGNHQDAWVNGATDPISGLAALLEEAKSIGLLGKNGWKPSRTLVYCAWDGEEPALLGSTEWVETHLKELKEKAALYINTDGYGRGFFYAEGSHALEPFINEIAKQVTDPEAGISLFDRRKAHDAISGGNTAEKKKIWNETELKLEAMGSGTDYSSFIQHAGISSLNIGFFGEDGGGDYHSIYDTYAAFVRFKDPGFKFGITLAETTGRMALRFSEADCLPFDFTHLYSTVNSYSVEVNDLLNSGRENAELENELIRSNAYISGEDPEKGLIPPPMNDEVPYLDFSPLQNAIKHLGKSSDSLKTLYNKFVATDQISEKFNKSLYMAERQLINEAGLPRREWYKHVLYAPGFYTGYAVKTLPGIREAIEHKNWKEAQEQIITASEFINKLADYLENIDTGQ